MPVIQVERPDSQRIVDALRKVHEAEQYLEEFGRKNDLPVRAHVTRSGNEHSYGVSLRSSITGYTDSGRWFLSNGKRNSTSAYAGSIRKAEEIILEAAAARKAKITGKKTKAHGQATYNRTAEMGVKLDDTPSTAHQTAQGN